MRTKQMDARGFLSTGEYLELPCRIFSITGGWYYEVHDESDLMKFLKLHHATPGACFDVEAVWHYWCEQPGDVLYTGKIPEPKHNTQGMMPGFEAL